MFDVLLFTDDSAMMTAIRELDYDCIDDIETMDKDEIMALKYVDNAGAQPVTKDVPMKAKKRLLHLLWWRDHCVSQQADKHLAIDDWMKLTDDTYEVFRSTVAANIARVGSGKTTPEAAAVTSNQVLDFQRGHKRNVSAYMEFSGDRKSWFKVKRNWMSNAANDGIEVILSISYEVPEMKTEARQLFDSMNKYFYNALQNAVKSGQALILLRESEDGFDGRQAYLSMLYFYERAANLSLIKTQCISELSGMKLNRNYPGGALKFFNAFQNTYLDLESASKKPVPDEEKIGVLNASLEDSRFLTIRTTMETLSLQTGYPIDYANYLQAMITHAENLHSSGYGDTRRSVNRTERGNHGDDDDDSASPRPRRDWRTDLTAHVPYREYMRMTQEERDERVEAKRVAREARQARGRNRRAGRGNAASTSTTGTTRQVNTTATVVSSTPDSSTPNTVSVSAPPASDAASHISNITTPTIREIMAARTQLPPGTYTDQGGRQFQINTLRTLYLSKMDVTSNDDLCLIDGGANNGLAGANMRLFEMNECPERIDVVGASDQVESGMTSLPLATYCAVITSATGVSCLGLFPNYVGYGKGKSILSVNQSAAFGLQVYDRPRLYGGAQKIISTENYVFKLKYKDGLTHLPIQYPSDADIANLPHVYICSPGVWNPEQECDQDDDVWYDTLEDPDELDDDDFYDSRDGWISPERLLAEPDAYRIASVARVNKPWDYEALRPFFGWKPVDVVKKTMAVTTQYASNVMRLPLRRHYKSRFPALRVRRLEEVYATDTYFSDTPAHDGSTCVQLYCGRKSFFTSIFGMKTESQMPGTLLDFIRRWGAMQGLFSDNAKVQTSLAVRDILRQYCIEDMQSEPLQQNQNPAERRIQEVKSMTNVVMDRTGAPTYLWLLCMTYCVYILNHLSHPTLDGRPPLQVAFGTTVDISSMLCFFFFQPILYYVHDSPFPHSREKLGRFVGFSETIGDALTFMILTDDTKEIIHRSVVRPAHDVSNPNARSPASGGEDSPYDDVSRPEPPASESVTLSSFAEVVDPTQLRLPTLDPLDLIGRTFLRERDVDGTIHRAEVIKRIEGLDDATDQFLVRLGDGTREDVMTYDAVVHALDQQLLREANQSEEEKIWIFHEVMSHRRNGRTWDVLIRWEDDSQTWEPLGAIWRSDPVTLAKYAKENDLLHIDGWKRLRAYVKNDKKFQRLQRQVRLNSMRDGPRIKFGVRIPRDYAEAILFDTKNKNTLWQDGTATEMNQLYEYKTFKSHGKNANRPRGYTMIRVHLIFDVKQDGRRKARCVAGGHMTGPNTDTYYSSVVSLRSMRIVIFLAELNGYELCTGDIGNAYLEAKTDEKVCFIAGKEFATFGHEGHLMVIIKALYGLKTSGARFHEKFADSMRQLGYTSSKADADVWMKDCGSHWEYVCTYVDDVIYGGKDPKAYFQNLLDMGYKLKGVGEPKYHLGGDFTRVREPESVLTWGSHTYVKRMMANYEQMFGEPVPKREIHAPLEPGDHPELDESELLPGPGIKIYWQMIGEMQWAVALGRIDLISATVAMARFRPAPRTGHLDRLKRVYTYLRNYKKTAIKFNIEMPDYSQYEVLPCNWGHIYHPCSEEIPHNMPEPRGKPILMTTFVDANLLHDMVTGRSCTGIIHMLNKTPIEWFSKRQNTVETATYGSEFVAARIAVDQIVDLRYTLRMLGVPLTGPSWMFGDNLSVVNSSTMPGGKLLKRHNILNYHRVREAQAVGIINFVHMNGKDNPADICTKFRSSREWYELMKPLIFWRAREVPQVEGSVKSSTIGTSTVPSNTVPLRTILPN